MKTIIAITYNEIKIHGLHMSRYNENHNSMEIMLIDDDEKVIHIEIFNNRHSILKQNYTIEKINDTIESLDTTGYIFKSTCTYCL